MLYQRGNKWWAKGYYWDAKQNRRRRWRKSTGVVVDGTVRTKRIAEQSAHQIAQSYATGTVGRSRPLALKTAIALLIGDHERAGRAQETINIVNEKAVHLFEHFTPDYDCLALTKAILSDYADWRLSQVARPWAKERLDDDGKPISRKTVKRGTVAREFEVLRSALQSAKAHGKFEPPIPEFPSLGDWYEPKERWLPKGESQKLLMALPPQWRDHFIMWRQLGIDESELYRIERSDISWGQNEVRVRGTKNKYRDRKLPMPPEVRELLERRSQRKGPLFATWTNALRDIKLACVKAEIDECCIKDLRRSFATELAIAGKPILLVAKLMGHKGTRMLEKVYARVGSGEHMHDVMGAVSSLRATGESHGRKVTGGEKST